MDYGQIISRGWRVVWENKFMIVLGFLAALGGSRLSQSVNYDFGPEEFPGGMFGFEAFIERFGPLLVGLTCVVIALAIVSWLVRLAAQGGLIAAAARIHAGEQVALSQALSSGMGRLGGLVGLNVVMFGPFTLIFGLIIGGLVVSGVGAGIADVSGSQADVEGWLTGLGFVAICGLLLACILVPLLLIVTFVYPFAQRGLVLKGLGVVDSIRHGWRVLSANAVEIFVLALIFVVIGFLFGLLTILVMAPLGFLAVLPAVGQLFGAAGGGIGVAELGLLIFGGACLSVVAAVVNAILVAFRSATFTLAYEQWTSATAAGN